VSHAIEEGTASAVEAGNAVLTHGKSIGSLAAISSFSQVENTAAAAETLRVVLCLTVTVGIRVA
jgi:hypothetical protein